MAGRSVSSVNFQSLDYFCMLLIINCYNAFGTGQHQVITSSHAVLAKVGDDVILPCHIDPPKSMERRGIVEWSRPDLNPPFVLLLRNGRYLPKDQNSLFKERMNLFHTELPHGNISLKLTRVELTDQGTYHCYVPDLDSSSTVQLLVGTVSQPEISSNGPTDGGRSLTCDSGCWYPEPQMSWLDADGNIITAESSVTHRPSTHCYTVQSNVRVRRAGHVTCRVHLPHIKYSVELIHVPGPEMREGDPEGKTEEKHLATTKILVSVFVVIGSLIPGLLILLLLKRHSKRVQENDVCAPLGMLRRRARRTGKGRTQDKTDISLACL